uniref:LIM zinc-binding domain-containing protein n=1 Tax=Timema genevievae TaxID=629358 RepID=A0A7R9JSA5_TIMGE|nr:unnamed protein product [Timema genevievae]
MDDGRPDPGPGERFDSFDSEYLVSVDNLLSLDALLADLQNTISPPGSGLTSPGSGYGSLNGPRLREHVVTTERYENSPASPTYQNQHVIHETVTTTKMASPPVKMASLNNNLSELDTLLQDLSNARYAGYTERRGETYYSLESEGTRPPLGGASGGTGASSATKELDDLMASLSDFKAGQGRGGLERLDDLLQDAGALSPQSLLSHASRQNLPGMLRITASSHQHQTVTDSPYAKPNKATKSSPSPQSTLRQPQHHQPTQAPSGKQNQLDSMLGNLQADMSRQGVNTTQKGCCNACDKPIVGQVITALGKTWHPEHFTCNHCNQELGTRNFFERDGHPYCEPDYHNLFSPRCAYCNGPILDKCVTALEKTWHTEHFFCAQCGKQFGEDGFHERDGKPYCRDDYFDMFAPKCGGCNRPIMENYISALNSQWHADCFVCRDCRQPFHGGSFFDHEGLPYCETHYHAKRGSLCAGCHKPITGRCITAMFRKFHPEHFVCAFCLKQLNKGTFKEQNDKPYCHACFDKLFG